MNNTIVFRVLFVFSLLVLYSCQADGGDSEGNKSKGAIAEIPEGYRKLSAEEMIEKARIGEIPEPSSITYKLEDGGVISKDSMMTLVLASKGAVAFDDYVDENGLVKFAVIRKDKTPADFELEKAMFEAFNEGPEIKTHNINCDSVVIMLKEIERSDQLNHKYDIKVNAQIDFKNLEKVVSILDQCQLPKVKSSEKNPREIIASVIEHAKQKYQKQYLSVVKEWADKGEMRWELYCRLYDRIKVGSRLPQLYGTQARKEADGTYKLYPIEDLDALDARRKKLGMVPIDVYLKENGIEPLEVGE